LVEPLSPWSLPDEADSCRRPCCPAEPPATPAAAAVSLDTPIEQLLASEKTKAILDARVPGLTSHPMLDQFKSMSLKQLQPMAGGQLTDAMLEAVAADLAGGK
jgi:hypothetical protein